MYREDRKCCFVFRRPSEDHLSTEDKMVVCIQKTFKSSFVQKIILKNSIEGFHKASLFLLKNVIRSPVYISRLKGLIFIDALQNCIFFRGLLIYFLIFEDRTPQESVLSTNCFFRRSCVKQDFQNVFRLLNSFRCSSIFQKVFFSFQKTFKRFRSLEYFQIKFIP